MKYRDHAEEIAGAALLAIMAILAFVNVLTRYFIRYSFAFTEEVEVALLVWLTMLGAAAGFRRGAHLGFHFLTSRFPAPLQKIIMAASAVMSLVIFGVILVYGILQIRDELSLGITTEALGIPQWWYTLALPVGSIIVMFRVCEAVFRSFRTYRHD